MLKVLSIIGGVLVLLFTGFGVLLYNVGKHISCMHRCGCSYIFRDY